MQIDISYLKKSDTIIVACSGGPDSMCLLHLLINSGIKNKIVVAHVNHKLRKESDIEYQEVAKFCKNHELIFEGMTIDSYGKDNFHNEARVKRYDFFRSLIKKYQASYLYTAHHGDDLIETILLKISRGSNLSGYLGFREFVKKENYTVVRPLIRYTKAEIINYMDQNHYWYALDLSNDTDHYKRNRYRHNILPYLKKENPDIHTKYLKYNKELEECENFINDTLKKDLKKIVVDNKILINEYQKKGSFVKKRLISNLLHRIYGDDLYIISDTHIELIMKIISSKKANIIINLPGNYLGIKEYNIFKIIPNSEANIFNIEYKDDLVINEYHFKSTQSKEKSNYIIRLNSSELKLPLYFRNRKTGDKMVVKNLNGAKKIKDILINEKITLKKRDSLPILVDSMDNVLWLPGIKKSKFDKEITEIYDIIIKCERNE